MESSQETLLIILDTHDNKRILSINKQKLMEKSNYFAGLFSSDFSEYKQNEITITVPNAYVMEYIIKSLIENEHDINSENFPMWYYCLEKIKCLDFLGLNFDQSILKKLIIPPDGFDLLLLVIDTIIGYTDEMIDIINKNFPETYDLSVLPLNVVKKMLTSCTKFWISACDSSNIKNFDLLLL
jgi:hypothetical protein